MPRISLSFSACERAGFRIKYGQSTSPHGGSAMPKPKWKLNTIYISERLQGEPAADLPLRADHRGRPDGLRKNHRGELVSGGARKGQAAARRPHQRVFRQSCDLLEKRAGRLCPRGLRPFCGDMPVPRTPPAAACWRTISAMSWRGKRPAICSSTIFTCSQTNA